jgi:HK97 family phage major capsid protein
VYGQLYAKVRKLNIKGGVKIPISDLSASFKWITESTVSPTQSAGEIKDFIEFSYNVGEIRVAETLLASIVTLDMFESEIVDIMLKAYVKEMDRCIIHGSGNGQMLGILNDPRVTGQAGHTIQMTAADFADWTKWRKNFFSKLPLAKRSGEFIFPVSTVESYLLTMADSNNNPIFRQATGTNVSDGGDGADFDRFFGRAVTLVEPDIIGDFDTASAGDVVGIFWTPTDYAINTQLQFGMKRYFDEEKNQYVNKALTIVDGKMVDVQGCYLIVKK